jgi:hypothetical protein
MTIDSGGINICSISACRTVFTNCQPAQRLSRCAVSAGGLELSLREFRASKREIVLILPARDCPQGFGARPTAGISSEQAYPSCGKPMDDRHSCEANQAFCKCLICSAGPGGQPLGAMGWYNESIRTNQQIGETYRHAARRVNHERVADRRMVARDLRPRNKVCCVTCVHDDRTCAVGI